MSRTRVKICGLTREQDIEAAVDAGADAIGLVFYRPSPRFVEIERAATLSRLVPPFVSIVGLFVNPEPAAVRAVLDAVPIHVLQFHGDEDASFCTQFGRPYIKAVRIRPGVDLIHYEASFASAQALLVDAFVEGFGGGGQTFDWSLIPAGLTRPLVLSGGLSPANVEGAIRQIRPAAVDVSSGVEVSKGIKDARRIAEFIAGVRNADG